MNKKFVFIFSFFLVATNTVNGSILHQGYSSSSDLRSDSANYNPSQTTPIPENQNLFTCDDSALAPLITQPVTLLPEKRCGGWGSSIGWFGKGCNKIGKILAISCVALFAGGGIIYSTQDTTSEDASEILPYEHRRLVAGFNEKGYGIKRLGDGYVIAGHTTSSPIVAKKWDHFINYYDVDFNYLNGTKFGTDGNDLTSSVGIFNDSEIYVYGTSARVPGDSKAEAVLHQLFLVDPTSPEKGFRLDNSLFFGGDFQDAAKTFLVVENGTHPELYLVMSIRVNPTGTDTKEVIMKVLPHQNFSEVWRIKLDEINNQTVQALVIHDNLLVSTGYTVDVFKNPTSFIDKIYPDTGALFESRLIVGKHLSAGFSMDKVITNDVIIGNSSISVGDIVQVNSNIVDIEVIISHKSGPDTSYILSGGNGDKYARVVLHLPKIRKLFIGGDTNAFGVTEHSIFACFCEENMSACATAVIEKEVAGSLEDACSTNGGSGVAYVGHTSLLNKLFRIEKGFLYYNSSTNSIDGDCVRKVSVTITPVVFPTQPGEDPSFYSFIRKGIFFPFAEINPDIDDTPSACNQTYTPTLQPTQNPSRVSTFPSQIPSATSTTIEPSRVLTNQPSRVPTSQPLRIPTNQPSRTPSTNQPSRTPTNQPSVEGRSVREQISFGGEDEEEPEGGRNIGLIVVSVCSGTFVLCVTIGGFYFWYRRKKQKEKALSDMNHIQNQFARLRLHQGSPSSRKESLSTTEGKRKTTEVEYRDTKIEMTTKDYEGTGTE